MATIPEPKAIHLVPTNDGGVCEACELRRRNYLIYGAIAAVSLLAIVAAILLLL